MTSANLQAPMRRASLATFSLLLLVSVPSMLRAQWQPSTATSGPIYYNGGFVGIGTANPVSALVVANGSGTGNSFEFVPGINANGTPGNTNWLQGFNRVTGTYDSVIYNAASHIFYVSQAEKMRVDTTGNVGIGTTSPAYTLHVVGANPAKYFALDTTGNGSGGGTGLYETLWLGGPNTYGPSIYVNEDGGSYANIRLELTTLGGQGNRIDTMALVNGNVGIGTTTPQHLLHVAGIIGAEEIIVSATGADYVFSPTYHLRPLTEVGAYIEQNHHLPDIPSAAEVKEKGVSVGDMESKLLAKIEELTLHMIESEQQNRELRERIARLEQRAASGDGK
jgi:hypothetical protein